MVISNSRLVIVDKWAMTTENRPSALESFIYLLEMEKRFSDKIVFSGINPVTLLPASFVFNEPSPGRTKIMHIHADNTIFYSKDAGLNWDMISRGELALLIKETDVLLVQE